MDINKVKNLSRLIKKGFCTLLISTLLLIALLIIPSSASAQFDDRLSTPTPGSTQSNTVTLRPNANGAVNQWIPFLCLSNWRCVAGATVDTSYVLTGAANQTDLYNLSDIGASPDIQGAAITGITVRATAMGAGVFHLMVRTNGQNKQGPSIFLQRIYTTYNWTLPQNPVTNTPWTLDEVNSLQIGVATSVISAPFVNSTWAEVVFARPTPTPSLSPTPTIASCQFKPRGDANCDGRVNTDDFNIWRDEFLQVISSKSSDFNNDGIINTDDFNIWRDGFLNTPQTSPTLGANTCNVQPDANGICPAGCVNYGMPLGCITQEYADYCRTHSCPICLSQNSKISTPQGEKNVQDLKTGDKVYSADSNGKKVAVNILKTAKTYVGQNHKIINITLSDGRSLLVSAGHPTADGKDVATLKQGDILDDAKIANINVTNYQYEYTYDLLPDSQTGTYFANGILMGSTLKRSN